VGKLDDPLLLSAKYNLFLPQRQKFSGLKRRYRTASHFGDWL
jgi:hypothetical protein